MVKESLDEGYCDISGHAVDLDLVGKKPSLELDLKRTAKWFVCSGEMGGVKIFLAKGRTGFYFFG